MKTWTHQYAGGSQGSITQPAAGQFLATVAVATAGQRINNMPVDTLDAAVAAANLLASADSSVGDWSPTPQNGDTIIEKRADGRYDLFRIVNGNRPVARAGVTDLDQAKQLAREALAPKGTTAWYRDHLDAADHLQAFD